MLDLIVPHPTGTLPVDAISLTVPTSTQANIGQDDLTGTPPPGAK